MATVLVTGGFDPLHSGHVILLESASHLGSRLIVGLNSDNWLNNRKDPDQPHMHFKERKRILEGIKGVDEVIGFDEGSEGTANDAIATLLGDSRYDNPIIFANGGEQTPGEVPEEEKYMDDPNVIFIYIVGCNRIEA